MGVTAHGITYPDSGAHTRLWEHFETMADDIDGLMFPIFSDNSARDAAIPAPTAGRRCFVTGTNEDMIYRTAWVSASPRTFIKTAAEQVTNSTTLQNDDHIVIPVQANSRYVLDGIIWVASLGVGPNLKLTFALPASATMDWQILGPVVGSNDTEFNSFVAMTSAASVKTRPTSGSGSFGYPLRGTVKTAGTAGNCTLQWAQNSSSATPAGLADGSFAQAWKVA